MIWRVNWTLIRRFPEACFDQCDVALQDELHRYRLSLGRRAEKLNLMLLADGHHSKQPDQYPHIKKATMDAQAVLWCRCWLIYRHSLWAAVRDCMWWPRKVI